MKLLKRENDVTVSRPRCPAALMLLVAIFRPRAKKTRLRRIPSHNKVTMNSTDAAKGLKNDKGIVTLNETGTYFTIVGVQVGSRGGTGLVKNSWFQTNGKDADNSNCEQMVPTPDFTTVMISQGVGEYKKGRQDQCDVLRLGAGHWPRLQEAGRRAGGAQRDLLGVEDRLSILSTPGAPQGAPFFDRN